MINRPAHPLLSGVTSLSLQQLHPQAPHRLLVVRMGGFFLAVFSIIYTQEAPLSLTVSFHVQGPTMGCRNDPRKNSMFVNRKGNHPFQREDSHRGAILHYNVSRCILI